MELRGQSGTEGRSGILLLHTEFSFSVMFLGVFLLLAGSLSNLFSLGLKRGDQDHPTGIIEKVA